MEPLFTIRIQHDVNVNVGGIGQEVLNSLSALGLLVTQLGERIMATLEQVQAAAEDLRVKNEQLLAEVQDANSRTDSLIMVATATKDALVAVRAELEALRAAQGATPQQLDGVLSTLTAAISSAESGIAEANAQDAETDLAAGNVAP